MTERIKREEKLLRNRRRWQAHVQALQRSGLSRSGYCKQHNLSYHALTYWHRKFSRPKSNESSLVPVPLDRFPGHNSIQPGPAALRIVLPGRLSIEVGDTFSPATLSLLLAILEGR
jgi:transposase